MRQALQFRTDKAKNVKVHDIVIVATCDKGGMLWTAYEVGGVWPHDTDPKRLVLELTVNGALVPTEFKRDANLFRCKRG